MKIGIMGGTFNPIHLGHLILSEYIRDELGLDKIIFIPTGHPPHKDSREIASGLHRKAMVELSIKNNPYFFLSSLELDKKDTSYTIDTVLELKAKYTNDELFMIIGADSLFGLNTWKNYRKLLKEVDFIVADRL